MKSLAIVAGCVVAAVLYGMVHDQFTAHICVEYFSVFHPPVFPTQSPTLLAFGWGIIATWWMGMFLGVPLAIASRAGSRPKLQFRDLVRPIAILLGVMGVCALVAGICGFFWGAIPTDMETLLQPSIHRRFAADWWAHNASYLSGFFGGLSLCAVAWHKRSRRVA